MGVTNQFGINTCHHNKKLNRLHLFWHFPKSLINKYMRYSIWALNIVRKWPHAQVEFVNQLTLTTCFISYNKRVLSQKCPFKGQLILVHVFLANTPHTSQEPWPWNCENPKESVFGPSPNTPKSCSVVMDPQVYCEVIRDCALNQMLVQWISVHADPCTW